MIIEKGYDLLNEIKLPDKTIRFFWNDVLQLDGLTRNIKNLDIYENINVFIENVFKIFPFDLSSDNYSIYVKKYDISIYFNMNIIDVENIEINIIDIKRGLYNLFVKKTFSFNDDKFEIIFEQKNDTIEFIFERLCGCIINTHSGYDYFDILDSYRNNENYDLLNKKFKNFLKILKDDDLKLNNKDIAKEIYNII